MAQSISAAVFFVYAIVYLVLGMSYPATTDAGGVGPGLFPRILALTLVALTAWNLVRQLVMSRRARPAGPDVPGSGVQAADVQASDTEARTLARSRLRDAAVLVAFILGYILLMIVIGTLIPTFLFMLGVLLYFNRGKTLMNVAVAIGITVTVWLVFSVAFDADLPFGLYTILNLP